MLGIKSVLKTTAIDDTVDKIKAIILSGKYHIGDKIPTEKELCESLGVGRSTVREALSMLKAMGFIVVRHGRGAFVERDSEESPETIAKWFSMKEHELNDFFEVRCSIEILNIKYAILRRTNEDIEQLELMHNRFENATLRGDVTKMASLDEAFHMKIAGITNNSLLIEFNKQIAETLRPYRLKSFASPAAAFNAVIPHRQIMQALKDQDMEKGIEAIKHHIDLSLQDISLIASSISSPSKAEA